MSNKKHICVLICYNNYEHIVETYESICNLEMDLFIIENYSENTDKIRKYFENKPVLKYILFEKNIANNAMNIVIKDFKDIICNYEYITFSDCDLVPNDSYELFNEIYKILEHYDVGVCCTALDDSNLPRVPGSENWIPRPTRIHSDYIEANSGNHFMTFKQKYFHLITDINFLDTVLIQKFKRVGLKWVITKHNNSKHLTWDLYHDGNEYYEYKLKHGNSIWSKNVVCNYEIIK